MCSIGVMLNLACQANINVELINVELRIPTWQTGIHAGDGF